MNVSVSDSVDEKPCGDVGRSRMRASDFSIVKVIGRGAFGEVQLVSLTLNQLK